MSHEGNYTEARTAGSAYDADAPQWSSQVIAEQLTRIGDNLEKLVELKQGSKIPPELLQFLADARQRIGLNTEEVSSDR